MTEKRISSLYDLKPGDHIKTMCQSHHKKKQFSNIYHHLLVIEVISEKELHVIHNDGTRVVEQTQTFSPNDIIVLDYPCDYSAQQAIERAKSQVGKEWKMLTDNCEHLVTWAKTGKGKSTQVSKSTGVGAAGAAVGGTLGYIVPGAGTVIGGVIGGFAGAAGALYWYLK